ncbi:precorrin-6y C5,15-methyltransferase (decarboxylating), CbiE subunit [Candidatus Methanoperedens nitroreducens]|uniref:Precorrin-6y C5,15-methyltransferase (Decarboxylating), CbiE subunit n=1 Tax=Candidatus Methanoperedens nitratireducens TaxID=1392998 RepID=A0A062V2R0_9EURY|nr:cobalt-precorrin-7 (C(5))-methyltransferase [Candidatus Methanoperedens nitroreducens]KCZ73371.1 precorrin-6y C5,15-methyltransferase (decarboxylating), CbiE subunit [Candidatus Methanoperedens nitroreducens]MDJ1422679.1 cobalt-precorrin-7 (C(5))-methyltransferase [Candidatus Methanoperedens sp.]
MRIVGVGAGPNLLTEEAISAIESANIIFGSKRAIELAGEHIKCETREITDYRLSSLPEDAVVLSTGDPMLSGLGKFAKKEDDVIPGISSLQLASSRLCLDMENLAVITAHSRDVDQVMERLIIELNSGKNIFLLPDPSFGVNEITDLLKSQGLFRKISICERLAYPDERISTGTTEQPPASESHLYCVVIQNNQELISG